MSLGLEAETPPHAKDELRVPEPKSSLAKKALLLGALLFLANVALIDYDFIKAGGDGPGGYTPGIWMLMIAPTIALAAWLYASRQALRTFSVCLFPPAAANAAVWWGLTGGHSLGLKSSVTGALVAIAIWLIFTPLLGTFANHITGGTLVKHHKTRH